MSNLENSVLNWIIANPPPNLALWVAVLAVLLRVIAMAWAFVRAHKAREQSIVDEFWYRTIILPECWDPLIGLFSNSVQRLHKIESENSFPETWKKLQKVQLDFAAEKNYIVGRFVLLTAFNEELNRKIGEMLDELEDELAEYFASISPHSESYGVILAFYESLFWEKLARICKVLIKLHPEKRMPL